MRYHETKPMPDRCSSNLGLLWLFQMPYYAPGDDTTTCPPDANMQGPPRSPGEIPLDGHEMLDSGMEIKGEEAVYLGESADTGLSRLKPPIVIEPTSQHDDLPPPMLPASGVTCYLCKKSFQFPENLIHHLKSHMSDKGASIYDMAGDIGPPPAPEEGEVTEDAPEDGGDSGSEEGEIDHAMGGSSDSDESADSDPDYMPGVVQKRGSKHRIKFKPYVKPPSVVTTTKQRTPETDRRYTTYGFKSLRMKDPILTHPSLPVQHTFSKSRNTTYGFKSLKSRNPVPTGVVTKEIIPASKSTTVHPCNVCGKKFATWHSMSQHKNMQHPTSK